jgi:DNA-binding SARP family transcriptional activator
MELPTFRASQTSPFRSTPPPTKRQQHANKPGIVALVAIEFGLLGELRVRVGGLERELGGLRQKALLARLLVARNELVARDRLVEDLYGEARSGAKALQVAVGRLRQSLVSANAPSSPIESRDGGYVLHVTDSALDAARFERALFAGEQQLAAAGPERARKQLAAALDLWRGSPLAEFSAARWAQGEIARLEELHVRALELHAETELALGAHQHAIAELERLVAIHPARERARGLLMLALYRSGRQADALAAYRDLRRHLVDEHGIEPSRALRDLQQAILLQDPALGGSTAFSDSPAGDGPGAAAPSSARSFVGRVSELEALQEALERCRQGERVAALISGEPGIGKTRLADELSRRAGAFGIVTLPGRCDGDLELPFKPFAEVVEELLASPIRDELEAHVREHDGVLTRLLPMLALERGIATAPQGDDAQGLQYALFAAVSGLLHEAAAAQPLLLILEDLHWADVSSLLLLKHLLTTPTQSRLMIVATYRSNELGTGHPLKDLLADLHRVAGVIRLELVGLLESEVSELARIVIGDRGELQPPAVHALRRSTAGNPFFVTEVLHALIEAGGEPGRWDPEASLPVPESIRETVAQRVSRLGGDVGECLTAASVLGLTFDPELVSRIVAAPAQKALEAALEAGLLAEEGELMAFRHALIAQTLYEQLPAARRRELHQRAAAGLEERAASVAPATVAAQWMRAAPSGEDIQRAWRWARRAGDDAAAKLAPQEAARWFQQALELADSAPDAGEAVRCELLIELGTAQRQSGDPAFRDTLLEAARIAHRRGDDDALVRATIANTRGFVSATGKVDDERIAVLERALGAVGPARSPERARLLATLAGELTFSGDWSHRRLLSDEALEIAHELGDPETLVHVLSARNITVWSPPTLKERFAGTAECRRAADLLDDPLAQFQAVHWRASACIENGEFIEAVECRARARRLAERLRQPTALWMAGYDHSNEALMAGRLDDAERLANAAYELGQASGQPDALLILAAQLMVIRFEQGRLGETIDLVEQSLEQNPRITGFRSVLALGYCEERRYEEAARKLQTDAGDGFDSLAYDITWLSVLCVYAHVAARLLLAGAAPPDPAERLRELLTPWHEQIAYTGAGGWGQVEHYLGMLELALGDVDVACERLERALRRAERLPAPIWAEHSRLELGRALIAREEPARAEPLLRATAAAADALGCRSIARDAGELLALAAIGQGAARL